MAKKTTSLKPTATFTLAETLQQLEALGNAAVRKQNTKGGAGENQFGVKRGDLRTLANKIKTDHSLALELWDTGNIDAQFLATLILQVDLLSGSQLERLVKSISYAWVADWLHSIVIKVHVDKETLREKWMISKNRWTARAARVAQNGRPAERPDVQS